jgi:hypothetical protein
VGYFLRKGELRKFCLKHLKESHLLVVVGVYERIVLTGILKEYYGGVRKGFIWLKTGTCGEHLRTRQSAFRCHKKGKLLGYLRDN